MARRKNQWLRKNIQSQREVYVIDYLSLRYTAPYYYVIITGYTAISINIIVKLFCPTCTSRNMHLKLKLSSYRMK